MFRGISATVCRHGHVAVLMAIATSVAGGAARGAEPTDGAGDAGARGGRPAVTIEARVLAEPQARGHSRGPEVVALTLSGRERGASERVPLNLCLALDQSGSMEGDKIVAARRAALAAVRRLRDEDTVAVVAYDSSVQVLVPATRASNRSGIEDGVARLTAGGSTALFAGLVKCVEELRKFADPWHVNRIILVSDGLANVGPSSPAELGRYGAYLMSEGISVSTIGLGLDYNEDLMAELAWRSDGHHSFAPAELERALDQEMDRLDTVVARDVDVQVQLGPGLRAVRVLGRRAELAGSVVNVRFAKVYGGREHVMAIEVQPATGATTPPATTFASVRVSWVDLLSRRTDLGRLTIAPRAAGGRLLSADAHTIAQLTELLADDTTQEAIRLRDQGRVEEATTQLRASAARLQAAARLGATRLNQLAERQEERAKKLTAGPDQWNVSRKLMKEQVNAASLDGLQQR